MDPGIPGRALKGTPSACASVSRAVVGPGVSSSCVDTCDIYQGAEGRNELGSCSTGQQPVFSPNPLFPFLCIGDPGPGQQDLCPHVDTGCNMPNAAISFFCKNFQASLQLRFKTISPLSSFFLPPSPLLLLRQAFSM